MQIQIISLLISLYKQSMSMIHLAQNQYHTHTAYS